MAKVKGSILPHDLHDPEFVRQCEEYERQREEERKREAEEAAAAAELEALYDQIEATVLPHLREEAKAVNAESRIKPADRKIFEQFKDYCLRFDPPLPALPAHPAAVAAFLTSELIRGASHFMKRLNAISRIHRSLGQPDPCSDVLILALVRKIKTPRKEID
jgi:hypothetical protein